MPVSRVPDLEVEPAFLMCLALVGGFFTTRTSWEAPEYYDL